MKMNVDESVVKLILPNPKIIYCNFEKLTFPQYSFNFFLNDIYNLTIDQPILTLTMKRFKIV